jgi:hypothetical protein
MEVMATKNNLKDFIIILFLRQEARRLRAGSQLSRNQLISTN